MAVLAIRGLFKGLIRELFSFGALIAGLFIAMALTGNLAGFFNSQIGEHSWNRGLAFFVIFIVVFLVLKFLEHIILKMMEETAAFGVDKGLGLLLGLFEGIIICALLTYFLDTQALFKTEKLLGGSFFVPYFVKIFPFLKSTGTALMGSFHA